MQALASTPSPVVIANADLAAPRGAHFSIEPGFWGHQIADQTEAAVTFHGKPFSGVFDLASQSLGTIPPERIALCGDSLHTDVLGVNAMGWASVFVTRDGLFNTLDPSKMDRAPYIVGMLGYSVTMFQSLSSVGVRM